MRLEQVLGLAVDVANREGAAAIFPIMSEVRRARHPETAVGGEARGEASRIWVRPTLTRLKGDPRSKNARGMLPAHHRDPVGAIARRGHGSQRMHPAMMSWWRPSPSSRGVLWYRGRLRSVGIRSFEPEGHDRGHRFGGSSS